MGLEPRTERVTGLRKMFLCLLGGQRDNKGIEEREREREREKEREGERGRGRERDGERGRRDEKI